MYATTHMSRHRLCSVNVSTGLVVVLISMTAMFFVFVFFVAKSGLQVRCSEGGDLQAAVDKTAAENTDGAIVEQWQSATGMTVSGHGGVVGCWGHRGMLGPSGDRPVGWHGIVCVCVCVCACISEGTLSHWW